MKRQFVVCLFAGLLALPAVAQEPTPAVPAAEAKAEEKKVEDKKPEEKPAEKIEEKKPEPPKAEEKKPEAPKAEEKKPEAPKAEEKKPEAPKAEEKKPEAPKAEEKKPEPSKAEEKKPEPPKAEEKKPEAAVEPTAGAWDEAFAEWKGLIVQLRALRMKFRTLDKPEDLTAARKEYGDLIARGETMLPTVLAAAEAAYKAAPGASKDVENFLSQAAQRYFEEDQYEKTLPICELLIDKGSKNSTLFRLAGLSAYESNSFDAARKYLKLAKDNGALDNESQVKFQDIDKTLDERLADWKKEEALRKAEAEKDDLPRVEFKTAKGDIVIELFENEAPNTVANFISLVDKGYYKGLTFHRVLPGFMAQGGCPKGDGTGDPGYRFADELEKDKFRKHFRGSISMANSGKDTNGSQFFLTFKGTDFLDGRHTVFGRVIKGIDAVAALERIDPQNPNPRIAPDKILDAKVLRKRNHPYEVKKLDAAK